MVNKNDQKYRITIRNWDEYQREMRGGETRRRRREWVAVSVDLFSDPDFLALDQGLRNAWVGLLCHAGKVGPVFELCPSDARLLFRLRSSPDFELLANHGFIDLKAATGQDIQDRQDKTLARDTSKPSKSEDDERLAELKSIYPKRAGSQPWKRAMKAAHGRIAADGATWTDLTDGVRRYAEYCRQTDKIGTEYVMMAATFFGPDKHYEQPWDPPAGKAERRQGRTVEAGHSWLEKTDDQK